MRPGIDPKVDYAFKRLFGVDANRSLLIHLLGAVLELPPERAIVEVEILNPFNEKEKWDDKLSIVDIKARDQRGRQFNIEMQLAAHPFIRQRLLYYWARLHQQQLHAGDDYLEVKPTVGIYFIDDDLFPNVPEHHSKFLLLHSRLHIPFSEDQALHVVELPKFQLKPEELVSPLDLWCYFFAMPIHWMSPSFPPACKFNPFNRPWRY